MKSNHNKHLCPNCGKPISINDKTCKNCRADLKSFNVDDNEQTVVIKTFLNEFEAEIAKGILEAEGIESFVSKDDEGSMNPALQLTMGVKLHIFEKDETKALEILNSMNT